MQNPQLKQYKEDMIHPETVKWLKKPSFYYGDRIPSCVKQHSPGLYSFQIFKPEFVSMWIEEIYHIKKFLLDNQVPSEFPNVENDHGLILDNFGYSGIIEDLVKHVIGPIAKRLWWGVGEGELDVVHGFTTAYSIG